MEIVPRGTRSRLPRTTSHHKVTPSNNSYTRSTSSSSAADDDFHTRHPLVRRLSSNSSHRGRGGGSAVSSFFRSLISIFTFPSMLPSCSWLGIPTQLSITAGAPPSLGRKVTGTLFGHRRGHVSFAVQDDPRSEPVLLVEFAVSTAALVREMSSGLVRIALECEKPRRGGKAARKLFGEPTWTMYCNGRKCGQAVARECGEWDWHVLSTVQRVSVGAGVIPVVDDDGEKKAAAAGEGELLYMRARFERVVGSRDSEAFYMLNPDGNGGPELSIFLLRI